MRTGPKPRFHHERRAVQEYPKSYGGFLQRKRGRTVARPPESSHMETSKIAPMGQYNSFIREGVVTFTPAQAAKVLRDNAYAKNRDITRSPKHIDVLAENMRRGLWLPKDQIAFANVNGDLVLVNGHHRMAAQVQAAVDIEWSVAIYPCANDAEVAAIYARFDTNMKKRTDQNILGALGVAESGGIKPTTARALWRALPIIANNMSTDKARDRENFMVRHIADDRLELARDYMPEAREFEKAIASATGKTRQKLLTGSLTAMGLVTMRAHLSTAYRFWEGISKNDGLRRGDPRSTYLFWLLESESGRGPARSESLIFATAKAWNYYVEDKPLKVMKMGGNPIRVAGTIYSVAP